VRDVGLVALKTCHLAHVSYTGGGCGGWLAENMSHATKKVQGRVRERDVGLVTSKTCHLACVSYKGGRCGGWWQGTCHTRRGRISFLTTLKKKPLACVSYEGGECGGWSAG
jgi:hypothetical protein